MSSVSPSTASSSASSSREQRIIAAVTQAIQPSHIEVLNESHNHGGPGTETHYKLIAVSEAFQSQRAVARHQRIYAATAAERDTGLHALALHLYTPEEWAAIDAAPESPACRGGSQ
jgi:BolA protein